MSIPVAFGQVGFWQIVIILAVLLLFFGSNRLPKMARSLGQSLTEFKKGLKGEADEAEPKKLDENTRGDDDPASGPPAGS